MAIDVDAINMKALETLTIDSIDVGATSTEYVLTVSTERTDILIEQQFTPVKRIKTGMSVSSEVALAQFSQANLAIVYDQPASQIVSSVLTINAAVERGEVTFVAVGKAGSAPGANDANDRTFNFPQTVVEGDVAYNVGKATPTSLTATFTHLPDSNDDVGTLTDAAV